MSRYEATPGVSLAFRADSRHPPIWRRPFEGCVTGQGRILTAPKSDAGYRTVALPSFRPGGLEEHLRNYVEDASDAPLFTLPSGLPLRRTDFSQAWRDACGAAALNGVRPHDLRHHAAAVIARNPNVTSRELMTAIGHHRPLPPCTTSTPRRSGAGDRHLPRRRDRVDSQCAGVQPDPQSSVRSRGISAVSGVVSERGKSSAIPPSDTNKRGGGRNRTAVRGFAGAKEAFMAVRLCRSFQIRVRTGPNQCTPVRDMPRYLRGMKLSHSLSR